VPVDDARAARVLGRDVKELRGAPGPLTGGSGQSGLPIVWSGMLRDRAGYSSEAHDFVFGLEAEGFDVVANPLLRSEPDHGLSVAEGRRLLRLEDWQVDRPYVHVVHCLPSMAGNAGSYPMAHRMPGAQLNVLRTMFETDRIPPDWVSLCNEMDQVWVPSEFNVETFAMSGVDEKRLAVVPSPFASDQFDPALAPLSLPPGPGFTFLTVFGWSLHKGWDVLVRALVEEFERGEARLIYKSFSVPFHSVDEQRRTIADYIVNRLGRDPWQVPEITILDVGLDRDQMARLYGAADAFVLPSRGEGWGRPYMEAMAMELPVIGTRWSANLSYMTDDNSYLIDCSVVAVPEQGARELSQYRGARWAEPSVEHLRHLMRTVVDDPHEAKARGRRARRDVAKKYDRRAVSAIVTERLAEAGAPARRTGPPRSARTAVAWEGPQFIDFGMAVANRELCRRLLRSTQLELTVAIDAGAALATQLDPELEALAAAGPPATRPPDVTVRHQWPPDFSRPEHGALVLFQPWEFGSVPAAWVEPMNDAVDEIWVPSEYVRDCYVRSGVSPEKVVVVPLGVDPIRYSPNTPPTELGVSQTFKFLFVGGMLPRKGADLLLDVYLSTFGPDDDVCLVIKDFGVATHYRGQGLGARALQLQNDAGLAPLHYIGHDLTPAALAGLYTACDCLVHPYRGEGYGLPVVEAMASGLPVIVPRHGACLDYCSDDTALLVDASETTQRDWQVGGLATAGPPFWAEIDPQAMAAAMRQVVDRPADARALGRRAAAHVASQHSWDLAVATAGERLERFGPRGSRAAARPVAPPPKIAVCMIVRDESALIDGALESVADVADEVVVVDTGSVDDTVARARRHGARVVERPWHDDFAEARNAAIELADSPWILMVDGDQRLHPDSKEEVRRLTRTTGIAGFNVRILHLLDDEGTFSVAEHTSVRLFRNDPNVRFVGAVHEQLLGSDPGAPCHFAPSNIALLHEGARPGHRDARAVAARDYRVLTEMSAAAPDNAFTAYNLGVACRGLDRIEEAVEHLERAVALEEARAGAATAASRVIYHISSSVQAGRQQPYVPPPSGFLLPARLELANCLLKVGRLEAARAAAERAVAQEPLSPDAHALLAAIDVTQGRLDLALEGYRVVTTLPAAQAVGLTDRSLVVWKGYAGMGQVLLLQGRYEEALSVLRIAQERSDNYPGLDPWLVAASEGRPVPERLRRSADAEIAEAHRPEALPGQVDGESATGGQTHP
jgi:glycosyltransferase involved in cell wall biosynthesis/tetratricopeptide (TPR) repeat protein